MRIGKCHDVVVIATVAGIRAPILAGVALLLAAAVVAERSEGGR